MLLTLAVCRPLGVARRACHDRAMQRGDGRLTADLDPSDAPPRDACGVFGVWAPGEDVAKLTYFGLYALQHRGQESAGIAVSHEHRLTVYKDMGLVSQVFNEGLLTSMPGDVAIGHTRYSTTGASVWENAQPTLGEHQHATVALAHNGNLVNSGELEQMVAERGRADSGELGRGNTTDTALLLGLLDGEPGESLRQTALRVFPVVRGAFSVVFMDESTLYAARDHRGVRPLAIGQLPAGGWVVASETAALAAVGAQYVRDVAPGELIMIDADGLHSESFAQPDRAGCVFEHVYLSRPDTQLDGQVVYQSRVEMGRVLAREHSCEADMVVGVPESGIPAAIGYAEESGIPFGQGFVKNAYVGRTFIQPSQTLRQLGIRLKLNPLTDVIAGKRLVVVDDSIVRGNTQRAIVKMLRDAGATQVHVRISSPPVKFPCYYGIDFASSDELIAGRMDTAAIAEQLGADSLGYITVGGLVESTRQPAADLCTACFSGSYPLGRPDTLTEPVCGGVSAVGDAVAAPVVVDAGKSACGQGAGQAGQPV